MNTPQCIHKAGIPKLGNYRDVLFINFVAVPKNIDDIFYFEKDYEDEVWGISNILAKKFSGEKMGGVPYLVIFSPNFGFQSV